METFRKRITPIIFDREQKEKNAHTLRETKQRGGISTLNVTKRYSARWGRYGLC